MRGRGGAYRQPDPEWGLDKDGFGPGGPDPYAETALPSNGKTYRLVTETNGTRDVSSVPLTASEGADMLQVEADLHRAAGWRVSVSDGRVTCERGGTRRVVTIEEVAT